MTAFIYLLLVIFGMFLTRYLGLYEEKKRIEKKFNELLINSKLPLPELPEELYLNRVNRNCPICNEKINFSGFCWNRSGTVFVEFGHENGKPNCHKAYSQDRFPPKSEKKE